MKHVVPHCILAIAVLILAVPHAAQAEQQKAVATMAGPGGEEMGVVTLTQTSHGVLVAADLNGLTPGGHGFHIHETGSCEPDFKAAGGHYNPHGGAHGYAHGGQPHAGDMPNIYAGADGSARADVLNPWVTMVDGEAGALFDEDGSAIIIHAKPDTYGDKAGAGARVACGVIARQ